MSKAPVHPAAGVPRWLVWVGSVLIAFHLVALVGAVTAVPSGPWPSMNGSNLATPPQFAFTLNNITTPAYLQWLKLSHSYHFPTNRPGLTEAYLEVRLKNDKGEETETLKFPDPKANTWVRYRQGLLAQALTDDQPFMTSKAESIAGPKQRAPTVLVWTEKGARNLVLELKPEHLLTRMQMVMQPSEWNLVLVRSYERYLCRTYGAARAEVIRHSKEPIPPAALFMDNFEAGSFDELVSNYGELQR